MPFSSNALPNGDHEVVMKAGTLSQRVHYDRKSDRRFAYCTHENDAQVIADALNLTEKLCQLHQPLSTKPGQEAEISIIQNPAVPENEIWISSGSGARQDVYFEKEEEKS